MSGMYDVRDTRDLSWSWSVLVGTRPGRFGHAGATHSDVLTRVHDRGADEWYIRSNSPIHPSPPGCGVDIRDATAVSSRPSHHPPPEYEWPLLSLEPRRHRRPRLRVQRCAKPPLAPPRQLAQCGRSRQVQAARPARSPDEGKPLAWTRCASRCAHRSSRLGARRHDSATIYCSLCSKSYLGPRWSKNDLRPDPGAEARAANLKWSSWSIPAVLSAWPWAGLRVSPTAVGSPLFWRCRDSRRSNCR